MVLLGLTTRILKKRVLYVAHGIFCGIDVVGLHMSVACSFKQRLQLPSTTVITSSSSDDHLGSPYLS